MTFYDRFLKGIDYGKLWPSVVIPTVAAYNGFLAYGIKQLPAAALSSIVFLSSLVTFLVVPKTPEQLSTEPRVLAEVVRATVQPVYPVIEQVQEAVAEQVQQVQQVQEAVTDTVREATDPVVQIAVRLERAAAVLRGED